MINSGRKFHLGHTILKKMNSNEAECEETEENELQSKSTQEMVVIILIIGCFS